MSLRQVENTKILELLEKQGGEGSTDNNIMRLISDEAYSQLSGKFPALIPYIMGINMVEKIDDKHALGAAKLMLPSGEASIPVVYSEGQVDATTFLYNETTNTMVAMTKKSVALLVDESGELLGEPTKDGDINPDNGDIHSLFVPPKTYNPKIASHGILFQILEQDSLLKEAFCKKLQDPEMADLYSEIYGNGIVEYVSYGKEITKVAQFEEQKNEALFSMSDVLSSSWIEKRAAADEFSRNGFVISHGTQIPSSVLVKEATISTDLTAKTGMTSFEAIDSRSPGAYEVYKLSDLSPVKVIVSRSILGNEMIIIGKSNIHSSDTHKPVGRKIDLADSGMLQDISSLKKDGYVILLKDGNIFGSLRIRRYTDISKESGDGKTVYTLSGGLTDFTNIVVENDSSRSPLISRKTIYVGSNNIKFISDVSDNKRIDVVTLNDINISSQLDNGTLVKVAHDGHHFIFNGQSLNREGVVMSLLSDGYDKNSIYDIVKTAEEKGSAELIAISAKIDMLSNMVMNLAGAVQMQQSQPPMPSQDPAGLAGMQQPEMQQPMPQEQQPQQGGVALPDESGMPMGDQQPNPEMVAQDQQMLGQEQQMPGQEQQAEVPEGMNQNIDPEVLRMLSELKDSSAMDAGVISDMADSHRISSIVSENKASIIEGASSLGKVLLSMMSNKGELEQTLGEKKYKKIVSNLKSMFSKSTDLYIDIIQMDTNIGTMEN